MIISAVKNQISHNRRWITVVLILIAILGLLTAGLFYGHRPGSDPGIYGNDFSVYYFASREMIAGHDPYQNSIGEWVPYLYTPLLAELLMPLAMLPIQAAAYIWFLISAASIALAVYMLRNQLAQGESDNGSASGGSVATIAAVGALLIAARFVLDTFYMGQVNTVVMMLAVAHVYLYSRNRKTTAALMLALAATMKVTPAVLIFYHLARMRLKYAGACIALTAILTALSFAVLGKGSLQGAQTFFNRTIANGQGFDLKYSGNQSLRGFELRLSEGSDESNRTPREATTILISVALLGLAGFASRRGSNELEAAAPFFCLAVILSPLSWKDHYVIIIPAIAVAIASGLAKHGRLTKTLFGGFLVLCFLVFNITSWRIVGLAGAEWADSHSLIFAGGVLIFALLLIRSFQLPRALLQGH